MSELDPIRVLCVFSTLDRGGAETMCMNIYRHIDRSKVQLDFVKHTHARGAFEGEIETLGGHVYEAPRLRLGNIARYLRWWSKHLDEHTEHRIVHGHFFTTSGVYFSVCKRKGRITVAHSHSSHSNDNSPSLKTRAKRILRYWTERVSDYRLACSHEAGEYFFPNLGFTVLPNAIDTNEFDFNVTVREEVRRELRLGDEVLIGTVGSLTGVKNPLFTLEVFRRAHEVDDNIKLIMCGDGPLRGEVESRVRLYGLKDCVILTGVRDDIGRILQAVDVFVMPSLYEGLGMAAIEAQAAGVPCVLSDRLPSDVVATNLCTFVGLDDQAGWVAAIFGSKSIERRSTACQIVDAGYDVRSTSRWLQDFYTDVARLDAGENRGYGR